MPPADEPRTSRAAIAALVLSLTPIPFVAQLIGLILAIVALVGISDSEGRLTGKGLALAALIISGLGVVFLPVLAILAGMMLPALASARESARRAACCSNLAQIGKAMYAYEQNTGAFPTSGTPGDGAGSLSLLHPMYLSNLALFRCPSSDIPPNAPAPLTEQWSSYHYDNTMPAPAKARPDRMLVWDKPGNHDGGRNVLFLDGHVSYMTEAEFQTKLAEQKAAAKLPAAP